MAQLGVTAATMIIGSNAAIRRSAEAGLGVALLPAEAVVDAVKARALVTIRTAATPLSQPWHLVARSGEALAASTRQFIDDLVNVAGEFEFTTTGATLVPQRSQ
jgi:DNA-binding transcriptional LysR family regulator